jgi:hypothetical protein
VAPEVVLAIAGAVIGVNSRRPALICVSRQPKGAAFAKTILTDAVGDARSDKSASQRREIPLLDKVRIVPCLADDHSLSERLDILHDRSGHANYLRQKPNRVFGRNPPQRLQALVRRHIQDRKKQRRLGWRDVIGGVDLGKRHAPM